LVLTMCHCGDWGCIGLGLGTKGELAVHHRLETHKQDKGCHHHLCDVHLWLGDGTIGPIQEYPCVWSVPNAVDRCIQVTFNGLEECECEECKIDRDFNANFSGNLEGQVLVRTRSESM